MRKLAEILEEFANFGWRCAFDLRNGLHYEGYICDVTIDRLEFWSGGPLAPEEPIFVSLIEIDLNTLSYFDESQKCYVNACWHPERACWIFSPSDRHETISPIEPANTNRSLWAQISEWFIK